MNYEMKIEYMVNAEESRILRNWERKMKRKARTSRANYPMFREQREAFYKERMLIRNEQRYLHLARGFVSHKKYGKIEDDTCRKPVDIEELLMTLQVHGYFPEIETLEAWLNDEAIA